MAIELETERLRLRQWRESDYAPFAASNADSRVMEYFPSTLERAAGDAIAVRLRDAIASRGWGRWAVELKTSGEFIGFVGLDEAPATLPISPCVEIGSPRREHCLYRLTRNDWSPSFASKRC